MISIQGTPNAADLRSSAACSHLHGRSAVHGCARVGSACRAGAICIACCSLPKVAGLERIWSLQFSRGGPGGEALCERVLTKGVYCGGCVGARAVTAV